MKILVYGAGTIGSLYAAKLKDAGHDVTILARGRRLHEIRDAQVWAVGPCNAGWQHRHALFHAVEHASDDGRDREPMYGLLCSDAGNGGGWDGGCAQCWAMYSDLRTPHGHYECDH